MSSQCIWRRRDGSRCEKDRERGCYCASHQAMWSRQRTAENGGTTDTELRRRNAFRTRDELMLRDVDAQLEAGS